MVQKGTGSEKTKKALSDIANHLMSKNKGLNERSAMVAAKVILFKSKKNRKKGGVVRK